MDLPSWPIPISEGT